MSKVLQSLSLGYHFYSAHTSPKTREILEILSTKKALNMLSLENTQ